MRDPRRVDRGTWRRSTASRSVPRAGRRAATSWSPGTRRPASGLVVVRGGPPLARAARATATSGPRARQASGRAPAAPGESAVVGRGAPRRTGAPRRATDGRVDAAVVARRARRSAALVDSAGERTGRASGSRRTSRRRGRRHGGRRRSRPPGRGGAGADPTARAGHRTRAESVAAEGARSPVTADDARPDPPSFPGRAGGSAERVGAGARMTRESDDMVILPVARTSSETRTGDRPRRQARGRGAGAVAVLVGDAREHPRQAARRGLVSGTGAAPRTADTSDHQRGGCTLRGSAAHGHRGGGTGQGSADGHGPPAARREARGRRGERPDRRRPGPARARDRAGAGARRWSARAGYGGRRRGQRRDGRLTASSPGSRCARPRASRSGRRRRRR